jgi:sec-independent protein translocase protein TatC
MSPENPKKPELEAEYHDPPMTLWDHLGELRKRLFISILALAVCSAIAGVFSDKILGYLAVPFVEAWHAQNIPGQPMLHFQTPAAGFFAYFELSILAGLAMASPILFLELWLFIAPGLYAKEKRFVIPFVVASTALFVGGGYFGWRLVFPVAFKYLLSFSGQIQEDAAGLVVSPTVMMGDYITFVTRMLLGFGIVFQVPLIALFLSLAGVINYLHLIRFSRWFIVAAFVVAAILTPSPDWTSQVMMAVPLVALYGLSILLAYFFGKPPTQEQRDAYKAKKQRDREEREAERKRKREEKEAAKKEKQKEKDTGSE